MAKQTAHTILMVEPVAFGFNATTAENNYFQQRDNTAPELIQEMALKEFRLMAEQLRTAGINLITIKDTLEPHTPDSIFPNNWVSFHEDGRVALYPMYAVNRRAERREDILRSLQEAGFVIESVTDYSGYETQGRYLEGTGSMILDRTHKIAYAALSGRTDKELFRQFCADFGYRPCMFIANQTVGGERLPIYHTNVMMCVGSHYVVVCLSSVDDKTERNHLVDTIESTGKEIVDISEEQMHLFAGNMLQVENGTGRSLLAMSLSAYNALTDIQKQVLLSYNDILPLSIPTIEKYGGGSVRCMMAEVFLPHGLKT
ncbi:amidinotransferase [Bacteroides sp. OttesenSCG-928-N06]|nr:amidinotransferase [Bacteroides sp. OttesenSCG-928-N06]